MVFLYQDPQGKKVFERTGPTTVAAATAFSDPTEVGGLGERVAEMERKIHELEDTIQSKDQEIKVISTHIIIIYKYTQILWRIILPAEFEREQVASCV